jgi:citrate synthase
MASRDENEHEPSALRSGLEGVVVAETRLSDVDGEAGRLVIAGHDVERIASVVTYEHVARLLLDAASPSKRIVGDLSRALGDARVAAFSVLSRVGDALGARDGMDALRAAVAHFSSDDPIAVTGAVAVAAAAWSRVARDLPPIAPDPSRTHAADLLAMIRGDAPSDADVRALDAYLVTVADHGMNASTFTARVIASTGSDLTSAIVGAIGALKGPLHGGAPGPVLDMLDAIGTPEMAEKWLDDELCAGRRIMGMGHRVYRVRDPRAAVLERAIETIERARGGSTGRLALARSVERAAVGALRTRHPDRPLHANVEFYTAVLLDALAIPRSTFTPIFAASRAIGWSAHVVEQRATGRLIRPASRYVGDLATTA